LAITPSGLCPIISPCGEVCGTQIFFALEMRFEQNGISMTAIICHQHFPHLQMEGFINSNALSLKYHANKNTLIHLLLSIFSARRKVQKYFFLPFSVQQIIGKLLSFEANQMHQST
jgi:hypothetical protein